MLRQNNEKSDFWNERRIYCSALPFVLRAIISLLVFLSPSLFGLPAFASDYSASITTSGSVTLNARIDQTAIDYSNINIITTCRAGYNLTLGTTVNDNNLYLDGDANNNGTSTLISPTNGTSTLKNSPNTWGFFASPSANPVIPTGESVFSPVPTLANEPAILRTSAETASSSDIDDSFSVYYGVNIRSNLTSGLYTMSPEDPSASTLQPGRLVYYLTLDSSCINDLAISFNKNLDGEGSDSDPEETITNFPESSDNIIDSVNNTVTLSSLRPARAGYQFKEWNTEADGTGNYYYPSDVISIGETAETETHGTPLQGFVTLYAIWVEDCASATVCYDDNHADAGTMDNQSFSANTTTNLIASNFSRAGYGFTGWNTRADGTGTQYGPNQNLTMPSTGGVNLYAQWLAPSGTLQGFSSSNIANNMNVGDILALEDNRDGEVYMVAKLADGNIWITENLRLLPNTATITNRNTNHPTNDFISGAPSSSSSTGQCYGDNATCVNQINYNAHNLDRTLTPAYDGNTNSTYWYSYGVMYNWYTATAGNGTYELTSSSAVGDLCPAGWHLPTGGASGEWGVLASNMPGNNGTAKSASLRSYPNNFLYSGDYNPSKDIPDGVGKQGRFWSTTPVSSNIKNAYRMGYNSTEVTAATSNSWNKWDNFAIRCIYQGGNVPYADVEVDFEGTGITSLTFTSQGQDTEIATPQSPTISLAENVTYDVTATLTSGYEVASWATSSGGTLGNSTTTNPAPSTNTYVITSNATLTVTGQLTPIYTVTTTLGEHVSSISFISSDYGTETITPASSSCTANQDNTYTCTIDLRRGIEYTISGTYESGYGFDAWATGAGGTLGDATSRVTTYTITTATTLSLTAKEAEDMTYQLIYHAGSGTDAPASETIISQNPSESFTITNLTPIYYGYTFTGWSETADVNNNGTTVDYVSGDTITITGTSTTNTKTLYPVYQAIATCPANNICYYDNGADVNGGGRGTMANQSSNTTKLIPSNYSRTGYGFAGWTTAENATPFGPNATIDSSLVSPGLILYAKWVKSEGDLQTWRGCNAMTENQVIALTDTRDNNVYAVAKLADGNCWTIENLRLDPGLATITAQNTHNPTSTFITESTTNDGSGNPISLSTDTLCSTDDDSNCINSIQYNTSSINRSLTPNKSASSSSWYSYGIYYNWYTATAGNGVMDTASGASVSGDICPKNWHLPTSTNSGEWAELNRVVNGGVSNADAGLRTYPVNLIWSGDYSSGRTSGYGNGRYWSSTGYDTNNAYRMGHQESGSKGSTPSGNYKKWDGFAIRCIRDEVTAEYSDLTVTLPQNVQSITFTHPQYGTETATAQDPVVSLAQDTSYTMTATFAAGYELGSWTGGNNTTIADSATNPTTIIITDDSTLTLTTQEIPTYTVTVSLDSGSTSVTFTNASYPAQTVTTTGSTVSLRRGVEYIITGTFDTANDYVFDSWTAGSGSTLGATNQNPTTYTVTAVSTLSLTSKQKTGQTTLLPGQELNAKMKTLAEGKSTSYDTSSSKIKSLQMADSLPSGFTPSSANTVSVDGSEKPIYIFFDNTDNTGIMYFYTDAKDIYMNTDSSYAFCNNTALAGISALSNWSTSSVTNMGNMFEYATPLTNIDALANWDTSSVTNMSYMFFYASALTNIDGATNWNTSSVTDMSYMFQFTYALTNIDGASNWNTSSVTDMSHMFERASALTNIDGASNWNTESVTNMESMFIYANSLTNIDALANWDTSSVTDMNHMFSGTDALTNIDGASNWDTSSVTDMGSMFYGAYALTNIDGASNWDTSSVTNMSHMFYGAYALTNIDGASNWDTSNVTDMERMFLHASALTNIDGASNWDTSSVTDMGSMFYGAYALTNIDALANWDTSSVTDMSSMFYDTYALTNASGANNWDIRAVTATAGSSSESSNNFYRMFYYAGHSSSNPTHPTFTTRSGTWNSSGTFIPGDTTSGTVSATVNIDSHISNIQFYGVFPGSSSSTTQTVSTSGSTITLNRGNSYRITATLSSGYELALWDPGEHGVIPASRLTINSRANDYTNFTPTGDTTLTATSQPIPSDITTTVNMDSNITRVSFCNDKYNTFNSSTYKYNICTITSSTGSTITLKQGATYRVTTATNSGYEVSTYTATGATITSTTGPHTDFTPSGNSTLTITSTTNTPTHTVTVNMDSNIQYVTFTNPDWPSKTAIRNGFTVDLRENTPYTATAYAKDDYVFSSWTVGANATISSTTTNPTTYTVTSDSTLTVTSEPIPTYTTTVNLDSGIRTITISNPRYGTQEITSNNTDVTLYEGIEYTITAEAKDGSEFSSWSTDSNGTLSSTTDNPAVFTISGTSTLSASTQALPTHQVTVNLDQGISSIGFYNADLGTQQVTTTGSTVNLYDNTDYIITATTNTGFNFATWTTGPNGTLTDATSNPTSYSVTSPSTLSASSHEVTQSSCATSPMISTVASGITYMQDINSGNKSTVLSALTQDAAYQIKDNRDNETYCVGKLADGNLWLLDNLALDLTNSTVLSGMTQDNTNASNTTLGYLKGTTTGTTSDQYATVAVSNWTSSYSYSAPLVNMTNKDVIPTDATSTAGGYKVGGYYNYCAATAGSYCYGNGTSAGTSSGNATEDICPKGWRMPGGSDTVNLTATPPTGEYQNLYNNSSYNTYANYRSALRLPLSGYFSNSSAYSQGSYGYWWSSTRLNNDRMYSLYANTSSIYPASNNSRDYGNSVRCVLDPAPITETLTVTLDSNVTSVTFSDGTSPDQTVTTNGGTVNLAPNTSYTITATTASGYEFSSWTAGTNATLGSTTTNPTTLTITGASTLSATSQQQMPSQSSCSTSPMIPTVASGITYMQDINSSNKSTVLSALTQDATYQIKDNRDNETYCVGKLADGNLWLLDNLALDLTNSTVLSGMNENNTHASNTTLNYLKNGGGTTSNKYAITGVVNWTDSPTYASSYSYSDPLVNLTDKDVVPTDAISQAGQYKIGGYYNYCAATAGSYCYGNGTSQGTSSGNATEDICPKGWRMPTGGSSGEYTALYNNASYNTYANYRSALRLPLSGQFSSGSASVQGSGGAFWSSTRDDNSYMYILSLSHDYTGTINPADYGGRSFGVSVRCLLDPAPITETLTVTLDSNVTSVTFSDGTSPDQTVTTNGGTVNLAPNTSYTITATTASGYEFSSWTAGTNATLGSTTTNPTTLTITGASTLSATSQQQMPSQSSCSTSPMIPTVASGITYMQDINSSNKSTVLSALTQDAAYQIKDNRDNETYCVGKLADGNLWLLDNLALDLTNSTVLSGMTQDNTNASNTTLGYLKGTTTGTTSDQYATVAVSNWTSSYSYSAPLVNMTNKDVIPTDATSTAGGYKVGGYYNYCAASAGSYCYGNGTSEGTSSGNATEDICPKGWRMPTGDSGEYQTLYSNSSYNTYANYRSALRLPLSGYFLNGSAYYQGSYGYWWSSTRDGNYGVYYLGTDTSDIYPANNYYRGYGRSVRCVLDPSSTTPQSSPSSASPVANLNNSANSAPVSANSNSSAETNPETSTPDSYSAPLGVSTTNSSNDDLASTSDTITETSSTSPLLAAISVVAASTLAGIGAYALIKKQEEAKEEPMNTESNEENSGESSEKSLGF